MTRRACFRECPRRYYYQYYASHNGWRDQAPALARATYRLKQLKSLPMLAGEALHEVFAQALVAVRGGGRAPDREALYAQVREPLNKAFAESKNRAAFERAPRQSTMLREFYYGTGPSDAAVESMRERLWRAIDGFLASKSFREAASAPFQEIKDVDHKGHFDLDGTRIYAAPDLDYRLGDGRWVIVDWKTGAVDEEQKTQVAVYGLYLRYRHGVRDPIVAHLEYVAEGTRTDVAIDEGALEAALREIRDSVAAMRGYLADEAENRPREREAFPLAADRRICPRCNFYEVCKPDLEGTPVEGPF